MRMLYCYLLRAWCFRHGYNEGTVVLVIDMNTLSSRRRCQFFPYPGAGIFWTD